MKRHSLEKILECTLRCCNITKEEWNEYGHRRIGRLVRVKQLLSLIAFDEGYEYREIARFLGHHRTTVIHHVKTINSEIRIYPCIQNLVDMIRSMLGPLPDYQEQMITYGWLARSSTGLLTFSPHLPEKLGGFWIAEGTKPFPRDQFPQVTYEKGPVKVKIKVTIEEDEKV